MDKLKMQTINKVNENIERVAALFPNCVTESIGADGKPTKVVDFDVPTIFRNLQDAISSVDRASYSWEKIGKAQMRGILTQYNPDSKPQDANVNAGKSEDK